MPDSPSATTASLASLARLRRELETDRHAMRTRAAEAQAVLGRWDEAARDVAQLALAAVSLHGWYTALEAAIERVARQLDGDLPRGERWHQELLSQAFVQVPGVRPPILDAELENELLALLAFRHFFRHAYSTPLDPVRLEQDLGRLHRVAGRADQRLGDFLAFLEAAQEALLRG
ncbi:MAG: hypothetical protein IT371_24620 [Deltaproteobacteria bacterium]|nr:hypothetical protein [Deltaproteobacteria bacterium]